MIRFLGLAGFGALTLAIYNGLITERPKFFANAGGVGSRTLILSAAAAPSVTKVVETWDLPLDVTQNALVQKSLPTQRTAQPEEAAPPRLSKLLATVQPDQPQPADIDTSPPPKPKPKSNKKGQKTSPPKKQETGNPKSASLFQGTEGLFQSSEW